MRLNKHLPEFIGSIKEFVELDNVITPELEEINKKIWQLQQNQFIESANEEGLKRYEQMLKIAPVNDIDMRRFNILNKYNSSIPFTMTWLVNTLNTIVGKGDFLIDMSYNTYTLTISIIKPKEHLIPTLKKDLRERIPANLILNIITLSQVENTFYTSFYIQTGDTIKI